LIIHFEVAILRENNSHGDVGDNPLPASQELWSEHGRATIICIQQQQHTAHMASVTYRLFHRPFHLTRTYRLLSFNTERTRYPDMVYTPFLKNSSAYKRKRFDRSFTFNKRHQ
jgi:hypothetical protein